VSCVTIFIRDKIKENQRTAHKETNDSDSDFVDVLLSLQGEDKIDEEDMIVVL
jgi:hypothetical protein